MVNLAPDALLAAASLFFPVPSAVELLASSEREDDLRAAAAVEADGARYVLKLASNAFTTPRRIEGWKTLIRAARSANVWMPALIPSRRRRTRSKRTPTGKRTPPGRSLPTDVPRGRRS